MGVLCSPYRGRVASLKRVFSEVSNSVLTIPINPFLWNIEFHGHLYLLPDHVLSVINTLTVPAQSKFCVKVPTFRNMMVL